MNKSIITSILVLCLLLIWGILSYVFLKEHTPFYMVFAIIVPALLVAAIIYFQHDILPSKRIHDIAILSKKVEELMNGRLEKIEFENAPKEVQPLINAINDLIHYFDDRYKQERDFTANASHELRTPLAGIRLQTEIAMKAKTEEQRDKALGQIVRAVDRGTRLVDQLLVLSRLTADRVELAMEAINLEKSIARTVAELTDLAKQKHIKINIKPSKPSYIEGNEESIDIMINNLIRNAITYCPKESIIDISVTRSKKIIKLIINDNGIGIPEEQYQHVLERFQKAERGSKVGTGLGLAIVKRIVDLHQGTLILDKSIYASGLQVIVTFVSYD